MIRTRNRNRFTYKNWRTQWTRQITEYRILTESGRGLERAGTRGGRYKKLETKSCELATLFTVGCYWLCVLMPY